MQVIDHINTANIHVSYTSDTAGASSGAFWISALDCRFGRFGYQIYSWYDESDLLPQERRRFDIRRRQLSEELEKMLFKRTAQIGADGTFVNDNDDVYLLDAPFQDRVTKIKYFHGLVRIGVPIAKLNCIDSNGVRYEEDCLAMNMVQLASWGVAVHCITVLQRKWRNRQWRLYVQPELIQLANDTLMQVSSV